MLSFLVVMREVSLLTRSRISEWCVQVSVALLVAATAVGCSNPGATGSGGASGGRGGSGASVDGGGGTAGAGLADGGPVDSSSQPWACAPPADPTHPPSTLAGTGCMDTAAVTRFVSTAHGYEVNSPLWSDAADKERAFAMPPGAKIHVVDCAAEPNACLDAADDGRWVFPPGTSFLKSFEFDGKLVETRRLLALSDGTWVGYTYQWNEAQTEATLVDSSGASVTFNTGSRTIDWTFPGQRDCTECHTRSAGWTLGPQTAQMNRVPSTSALGTTNQIDNLAAEGLFDQAPGKPYKTALVTPYPGQVGSPLASATVTDRARSYLHANCAFCHRPDGEFSSVDLRYDTVLEQAGLCNVMPAKGTQGVQNATNLTPGHPELSTLWLRMATLGKGRMPPLASVVLDQDALDLLSDWIKSIQTCP